MGPRRLAGRRERGVVERSSLIEFAPEFFTEVQRLWDRGD